MSLDSACPGHLSIAPRQLADIFNIFQAADAKDDEPTTSSSISSLYQPIKPAKSDLVMDGTDSDAATEVTSNTFSPSSVVYHPKIESLQRECEALKQIINTDSTKMLQLQGDRKILQENLDRCTSEKKKLEKQLRSLNLERQASLQRQKNQDETIKRLQAELDKAPRDKTYAGASNFDIEELRLANELLASQVVHAERQLERANSDKDSDKENIPPPETPNPRQIKNDWGVSSPCYSQDFAREVLADISPQALALQLRNLESRLEAMESRVSNDALEHVDKATQSENTSEGEMCDEVESAVIGWSTVLDGIGLEGVEIGLDGRLSAATVDLGEKTEDQHPHQPTAQGHRKDASKCPSGYFCDCFPAKYEGENNE